MSQALLTCTWAPTAFAGPQIVRSDARPSAEIPSGAALESRLVQHVQWVESLGITHLLVAQRWWGSAQEMEGSTLDCLAMTAFFAAHPDSAFLITTDERIERLDGALPPGIVVLDKRPRFLQKGNVLLLGREANAATARKQHAMDASPAPLPRSPWVRSPRRTGSRRRSV